MRPLSRLLDVRRTRGVFCGCGEQMSLATVRCFAEYIALPGAELALSNYSNDTESSNYDSTTIGFQNFLGES